MESNTKLLEILENLDDNTLIDIWNEYCSINNYEDIIYDMTDFNEILENDTPEELALKICCGDFSINHAYFKFDGSGNLQSDDVISELIYLEDLCDYIFSNEETFGVDRLEEYFENNDNGFDDNLEDN